MEISPELESISHSRSRQKHLSLSDRLALIGLIDEGMRMGSSESPVLADLFSELWELVNETASGSKINRLQPEQSRNGFRMFEVNSDSGENLGRLNMLYLKKPIPCYYLAYVEVSSPFRRKGLGNKMLRHFREFLDQKSSVGLLDNIIPKNDPTYDIYIKQAWEPIESIIGDAIPETGDYMIYIPPRLHNKNLREPILKLLYHLKRKREAIDMRDNEMMVQRTIEEFKQLYTALTTYFDTEIQKGITTPLMKFMFTRFVTKLIAFRRRIGELIGYTGGESMEQLSIAPGIAAMPVQSYAPQGMGGRTASIRGDWSLSAKLSGILEEHPARVIESLPNYRRPSFTAWLKERQLDSSHPLTIGDLMDLGFDPTRLKEITIDGEAFIFERIQSRQLPELEKKKEMLEQLESKLNSAKARHALIKVNPPLLVIVDRGNAYVLRHKVNGIHWEEALEQIQSASSLKNLNMTVSIDRLILATVRKANETASSQLGMSEEMFSEKVAWFVSWNLQHNYPKMMIEFSGSYFEAVWAA